MAQQVFILNIFKPTDFKLIIICNAVGTNDKK